MPVLAMPVEPGSEGDGVAIGGVVRGIAISQVLESRLPQYRPGELLQGYSGWEDYSLVDGTGYIPTAKVPDGVPLPVALGTLGITGMVAYFGVVELGKPKPGETFVITSAAGGVGSVAAQIAKIHGARVVAIAGGRTKCDWLTAEAGVDAAIDYKSEEVAARLDALCPDGIDIFFDNAGGPVLDLALERIRRNGRIVLCGVTSWYLQDVKPAGPSNYTALIMKDARMEGLLGRDYFDRFPEAIRALRGWLDSGQLKSKENVTVGLENALKALAGLYTGENIGKQLVKVADSDLRP